VVLAAASVAVEIIGTHDLVRGFSLRTEVLREHSKGRHAHRIDLILIIFTELSARM
jgi:hypothetical protein